MSAASPGEEKDLFPAMDLDRRPANRDGPVPYVVTLGGCDLQDAANRINRPA